MKPAAVEPAIEQLSITAQSAEDAHGQLGEALSGPIQRVVAQRLADTTTDVFAAQVRTTRGVALHLRALEARAPAELAHALAAYHASLSAWARGARLARVVPDCAIDRQPVTADELALWLQDDNTGCQTGLLRGANDSVLLFHTEEDTIGYFDRARVVHMDVQGVQRSAFLYPYLLPGPAFGFHAHGAFAYDTLNLARSEQGGTPTSTFSWLAWWTLGTLPLRETARALTPFLDGGALAVVSRVPGGVHAEQVEVGGEQAEQRVLSHAARARQMQVNTLADPHGPLSALELYDAEGRAPYIARLARAERLLAELGADCDATALARMLGSREGESWAFANEDVVAHFVAHVTREGVTVHAGAGPAQGHGNFDAVWSM